MLPLLFCICLIAARLPHIFPINVTIVTYGHVKNSTRTSVNNAVIGLDIARRTLGTIQNRLNQTPAVQFHYVTLTDRTILDCFDAEANVHLVAEYYYRHKWDQENVMAMITPGCGDSFVLAKLARGAGYGAMFPMPATGSADNLEPGVGMVTANKRALAIASAAAGKDFKMLLIGISWSLPHYCRSFSYVELRSRRLYPTYITLSAMQPGVIAQAVRAFIRKYQWNTLAALYDERGIRSYYDSVESLKWDISANTRSISLETQGFDSGAPGFDPVGLLSGYRGRVQVFLLSMNASMVRTLMLAAKDLRLTSGDYVFITGDTLISSLTGILHWQNGDSYDAEAREAYRSIYYIRTCPRRTSRDDAFLEYLSNITETEYTIPYVPLDNKPNEAVLRTYEAMEIYREIIASMLSKNMSIADGVAVGRGFLDSTFRTSGGEVYIGVNGQARNNLCVYDLSPRTGDFEVVMLYEARQENLVSLNVSLDWPNGIPPRTGPFCMLANNSIPCATITIDSQWIVTLTLSVVAVLIGSVVLFVIITRRVMCKIQMKSEGWIIDKSLLRPEYVQSMVTENHKGARRAALCVTLDEQFLQCHEHALRYTFRNEPVYVTKIKLAQSQSESKPMLSLKTREQLKTMKGLVHSNICRFFGAFLEGSFIYLVSEDCSRGTLHEFLSVSSITLEWDLVQSFIQDIMEGIWAIHHCSLRFHGSLTFATCLIDSRLTVKLAELGFTRITYQRLSSLAHISVNNELYLSRTLGATNFQPSSVDIDRTINSIDLHAFGVIVERIVTQYGTDEAHEVPVRRLLNLAGKCMGTQVLLHREVRCALGEICGGSQEAYLVRMIGRLQARAAQLENAVQERTYRLLKEKRMCETLLLGMLPRAIVTRLSYNLEVHPETFQCCSVYFSYVYGFNEFVSANLPLTVFATLNEMFRLFDQVLHDYQVYKMETVEDCYMVVSGVPERNGTKHAKEICAMALRLLDAFVPVKCSNNLDIMAGIHSGPCVAGIVGLKRPRYCLFGDTVNVAARLASHDNPARIQASITTIALVDVKERFRFVSRGWTSIKGRGGMVTFWLENSPCASTPAPLYE